MIGKIFIIGPIGNTYDDNGKVERKGVELVDVVAQYNALGMTEEDSVEVYIKTHGGSIHVGDAIAEWVSKLPKAVTVADEFCESIGTRIHLSRQLAERKIIAGTIYTVHNPLLVGVSGNAAELVEYADEIKKYETRMLKMYCSAVTIDKDTMAGLMQQETSLTDEQAKALGFASEIIVKENLKAVAFFDKPKNKLNPTITMAQIESKFGKMITDAFASVGLLPKKVVTVVAAVATAVAETLTTDGDVEIYTDIAVADFIADNTKVVKVFADAEMKTALADGDYTMKDGMKIKVAGGQITEVEAPEPADADADADADLKEAKAKIVELENTIATMEANFKAELDKTVNEVKAHVGSTYTPKAETSKFRKTSVAAATTTTTTEKKSMKEQAAERAGQYNGGKKVEEPAK